MICCRFTKQVYNKWLADVDEACSFNLDQPLLLRSEATNLISLNFDPQVKINFTVLSPNRYFTNNVVYQ